MKPKTVGRVGGQNPQAGRYQSYASLDTGLLRGAILLTLDGEIPVEFLSVGDKIITRDSGIAKVEHIQRSTRAVRTISFAAGSLGDTRPEHDALLAGDQMCLIRDWRAQGIFHVDRALVAARTLVDGEFITDLGYIEQTVFQLFCDGPHIIYADGLELGTADAMHARGDVLNAA
ncbi:hypothetical protein C1J03_15170 [Sulfitobacter sp. SK012]|uniref:Hint domain-containing protein n=1 Tax=Sulfitobacter sp. SK012 TaxID=1389005 RepID=UPI000E0A3B87|nr:Hint domain-containing protein [Sulfitobacter sp. SK012]AXI47232.1 hypothetical protein C1J03_15170 [Sulfitobacter sp. SK012]